MAKGEIIKQIPDLQAEKTDTSNFRRAAEELVDYVEKNRTQKAWELSRGEITELLSGWGFEFNKDDLDEVLLEAEKYSEDKKTEKSTVQ